MLVNVDNLVKGFSEPVYLEGNIELPKNVADNNLAFVKVDGVVTKTEDGKYAVKGKINAVLTLNCDSCLRPYEFKLETELEEVYTKSENPEEDELQFTDKSIDLEPAILADILLNLPMKAMCSENCKGLCHVCGHNLNDSDCGCDRTYIDPRFEILRSFINDKEV